MPGYLTQPSTSAIGVANVPSGNISASNVQAAINELDTEKASDSSVTSALALKAPLASPTFTGTVSASVANISSNLTVDTDTLFVDSINNRVGIGTTSPSQSLQVQGSSFLNGEILAGRVSSTDEGGQISLSRSSDNAAYWNIDVFGSTSTPLLRFFNDGTVKVQLDSSGRIVFPYQVSFRATTSTFDGNGKATSYATNTSSGVPYQYRNVGSHLNTTTGIFTAPVAGRYLITAFYANTTGTVERNIGHIWINNVLLGEWIESYGPYDDITAVQVYYLNANDTVQVGNNTGLPYNSVTFCGDLLG